jgi:hypothetical protein
LAYVLKEYLMILVLNLLRKDIMTFSKFLSKINFFIISSILLTLMLVLLLVTFKYVSGEFNFKMKYKDKKIEELDTTVKI